MTTKLYRIFPDGCRTFEVVATSHEMAYRGVCWAYTPSKKVAVLEIDSGTAKVYSRIQDRCGGIVKVVEHDCVW